MAENENGQEKSEEPTSKRLQKAREDGQAARSKELGTTCVLLGGTGALMIFGGAMAESLRGLMRFNFSMPREAAFDVAVMMSHFGTTALTAVSMLIPFFVVMALAATLGPLMTGGLLFSPKALAMKWDRMDPIKGIGRMFSLQSLVELLKSVAKFVLVAGIAVTIITYFQSELLSLATTSLHAGVSYMLFILGWSALGVSASMILIALIDVPYQMFEHKRKLKMTRQEVKDENKDSEGKPEVKRKVRQLQFEAAQRRMMEAIPQADVVITNPEHFAVALKYNTEQGGAPVVVAKGTDFIALKIREVAKVHEVQMLEIPLLARAIFYTTDLDREIPQNLYLAVAQVLAYVFQLQAFESGTGRRPKPLGTVDIPKDAYYDRRGRRWQEPNYGGH